MKMQSFTHRKKFEVGKKHTSKDDNYSMQDLKGTFRLFPNGHAKFLTKDALRILNNARRNALIWSDSELRPLKVARDTNTALDGGIVESDAMAHDYKVVFGDDYYDSAMGFSTSVEVDVLPSQKASGRKRVSNQFTAPVAYKYSRAFRGGGSGGLYNVRVGAGKWNAPDVSKHFTVDRCRQYLRRKFCDAGVGSSSSDSDSGPDQDADGAAPVMQIESSKEPWDRRSTQVFEQWLGPNGSASSTQLLMGLRASNKGTITFRAVANKGNEIDVEQGSTLSLVFVKISGSDSDDDSGDGDDVKKKKSGKKLHVKFSDGESSSESESGIGDVFVLKVLHVYYGFKDFINMMTGNRCEGNFYSFSNSKTNAYIVCAM